MYVFQFSVYDKNNFHEKLPNARVAPLRIIGNEKGWNIGIRNEGGRQNQNPKN